MKRKIPLTAERLRELLVYSKVTGVFRWRATRRGQRPRIGDEAGSVGDSGYRVIGIDGIAYGAHRLAWLYVTGEWPTHQVDHRNRRRDDNRWKNLRKATSAEQRQNQSVGSNNKTGFLGVRLHRCGKYEANIKVGKKALYLGLFGTATEASDAYIAAKKKLHLFSVGNEELR